MKKTILTILTLAFFAISLNTTALRLWSLSEAEVRNIKDEKENQQKINSK